MKTSKDKNGRRILFVALCAVGVTASVLTFANRPTWSPDAPLATNGGGFVGLGPAIGMAYDNGFYCEVTFGVQEQSVEFHWKHAAPGFGLGVQSTSFREAHAVSFWPSNIEWMHEGAMLVSGRGLVDGATIVERWTIEQQSPNRPAFRVYVDPVTSEETVVWSTPGIKSRIEVIRTKEPELKQVVAMKENRGLSDHAFILFESGQLHDYSLATGTSTLVAAAVPTGAALTIPELAMGIDTYRAVSHPADGYVYRFGKIETGPNVYLIDQDQDGVIDSTTVGITSPPDRYSGMGEQW